MRAIRSAYSSHRRWALAADVVLVVLFTVIGRASHAEPLTPAGIAGTAWPFVVACLFGWLAITIARLRHSRPWPTGVVVWAVSLVGGMLLRVATGDTAAVAFIVVAAITLAVFLIVPRLLFGLGAGSRPDLAGPARASVASPRDSLSA